MRTVLAFSMLVVQVPDVIGKQQTVPPGHMVQLGPDNFVLGAQDAKWIQENHPELLSQHLNLQQHRDPRSGHYDGIEVTHVVPGSLAQRLGARDGDVIKSINGNAVHSSQEAVSFVKQKKGQYTTWEVVVENNGTSRTITYEPPHAEAAVDPFPPATAGFTIPAGPQPDHSVAMTLEGLINVLERVTGVHFLIDSGTASILAKTPTGLTHPLEVPAERVWNVAESILLANDVALVFVGESEPKFISVHSLQSNRNVTLRTHARYVRREDLHLWAEHPAFLVQTVITLESTDVRSLSNSMRAMFTDASTQQILPGGDSNALILVGFSGQVASLADMLDRIDEGERQRRADARSEPAKPTLK